MKTRILKTGFAAEAEALSSHRRATLLFPLCACLFIVFAPLALESVIDFARSESAVVVFFNQALPQAFIQTGYFFAASLVLALPFGLLLPGRQNNYALLCGLAVSAHFGLVKLLEAPPALGLKGEVLATELILLVFFMGISIMLGGYFRRLLCWIFRMIA
ncbi:MAG TPA: hypothetical protein DCZ12_05655 [Gammaproteobacteria bacterium]|nr:hypothetical protein [Gammaproteobacteria bacterium]